MEIKTKTVFITEKTFTYDYSQIDEIKKMLAQAKKEGYYITNYGFTSEDSKENTMFYKLRKEEPEHSDNPKFKRYQNFKKKK